MLLKKWSNLKSFEDKVKLVGYTKSDGNKWILKNATIAVSLKYVKNIWRSLQMPLIYLKIELKFRWTNHCTLYVTSAGNNGGKSKNIIFKIKNTKF